MFQFKFSKKVQSMKIIIVISTISYFSSFTNNRSQKKNEMKSRVAQSTKREYTIFCISQRCTFFSSSRLDKTRGGGNCRHENSSSSFLPQPWKLSLRFRRDWWQRWRQDWTREMTTREGKKCVEIKLVEFAGGETVFEEILVVIYCMLWFVVCFKKIDSLSGYWKLLIIFFINDKHRFFFLVIS